ncbi:response regulator [Enterobacillus tribolii]|uniref:histidine kinase n=1 Tax=Enterobacillus tribolii TaxID=1487935 RepID=A0A370QQG9_9GAMM|nr:transporter substrate-binding domain-containing protein [Enterobacillus tribolii]MBW7981657.1 transporter substrate-binding domain-containing protein [Enterobacillus tribolii]RDK91036.1 multi-sensor hybrid histidine kinase [Enterobacillus tribolii]
MSRRFSFPLFSLLLLTFLFCGTPHTRAENTPASYQELILVGHSAMMLADIDLSDDEWRWLRKKRVLRLGTWAPNSPPYDITSGSHDYSGISADYAQLIGRNLNIQTKVYYYPDYNSALNAIRTRQIDYLVLASERERNEGLILSTPYLPTVPAMVMNIDSTNTRRDLRIAIDPLYADNAELLKRYPEATRTKVTSTRHALESLSFRQLDLFVGDIAGAQYIVNQANLRNLSIRPIPDVNIRGFSFAALPENQTLITIFNKLLAAIPGNIRADIQRRWDGGVPLSMGNRNLLFTTLERRWLEKHPALKVAIVDDLAPISFFDSKGTLRGIAEDIITALATRTAVQFIPERYASLHQAQEAIASGEADILINSLYNSASKNGLLTTRTFLFNSWAEVRRKNELKHKGPPRLAVLTGGEPDATLAELYPGSPVTRQETLRAALEQLRLGLADIAIMPLINADFLVSHYYSDTLRINDSLDVEPARFVLAVAANNYPLATILDKTLLNIPPEDLHTITHNWYTNANLPGNIGPRPEKRVTPWWLPAAAGVLSLFCLLLAWYAFRLKRYNRQIARSILDTLPLPAYATDFKGRIRYVNDRFLNALSLPREETLGKHLSTLLPVQLDDAHTRILPSSRLIETERADKKISLQFWNELMLTPDGQATGYIGGWIDITAQQNLISELKKAKSAADKANRAKSTFLATMSHEIRTPMSAIIGMLELVLRRKSANQPDWDAIHTAYESANSLLILIGDILDVSRIESDRLVLHPERANIRQLIESVAAMFEGLARQRGLLFQLEIDSEISGDVLIDPVRFKQIVSNLLSNAIKFTQSGRILLRAAPEREDSTSLYLVLSVQDSGCGIDQDTQSRLFRPFQQGDMPATRQGAGLGLYICRTLAQMMEGDITLTSQPGIGTDVNVRLRVPRLTHLDLLPVSAPAQAPENPSRLILIVEDHPAGRMLLTHQLQYLGHRVLCASDGAQALALLEQQTPDLIITDCNMPRMSGYELTRTLRQRYAADITIWGLTANAQRAVREECLQAGMDDCLFKPISINTLSEKLATLPALPVHAWQHFSPEQIPAELLTPENREAFVRLQIEAIEEALLVLDGAPGTATLKEAMHKLRGGLSLIGAAPLIALCRQAEAAPEAPPLDALRQEAGLLSDELSAFQNMSS